TIRSLATPRPTIFTYTSSSDLISEKEDEDANKTLDLIEKYGVKAYKIRTDIKYENNAVQLVHETIEKLGSINILIEPNFSIVSRSEEHTSELQSRFDLVCRLLL